MPCGSCHSYIIIRNGDSDSPKMLNYAKKLCLQKQRNDHFRMHGTEIVKIKNVSTRTYFTAQGTIYNTFNTLGLPRWLRWYRIHLPRKRCSFDSWVGKIPWRRKWQSTLVFLPGKSHGQRSLAVLQFMEWQKSQT